MARARRARTTVVVRGEVVRPWRQDAKVVRLTAQILDLHAKATARFVASIVQIGGFMAAIQDRLPVGEWTAWVDEAVPMHRRTIHNYIELFRWSQRARIPFQRFAHLGPTKLYVLAAGNQAKVKKLRPAQRLRLPDGRRKTVDDMTAGELKKVIGDLTTKPTRPKPIGKVVQSTAHEIAVVRVWIEELERRQQELPDGAAEELAEELRGLVARLEALA